MGTIRSHENRNGASLGRRLQGGRRRHISIRRHSRRVRGLRRIRRHTQPIPGHTVSALSDRADMIETQRERLHDGIKRIYDVAHAWCSCDYQGAVENEFEASLRLIDLAVIRAGAFYVVELKRLADKVCAEANSIEKEGTVE